MDKDLQAEIDGLRADLDRHGWETTLNTARLINTYLGYEKYAVWIPESEVKRNV